MLVCLTNDDGIEGEGLKILAEKLASKHDVWIIAPDRNRSGVSNHIFLDASLKLTKISNQVYKYERNPVDCALLAAKSASKILPSVPDCIVSGINRGANLGTDIVYSGTAAAARQAVLNGIPAVAFSVDSDNGEFYFDRLADFAVKNLEKLLPLCNVAPKAFKEGSHCSFVNVNGKSMMQSYKGVKFTDVSFREYNDSINVISISENESLCSIVPGKLSTSCMNFSDFDAVQEGFISVSCISAEPVSTGIVDGISFSL